MRTLHQLILAAFFAASAWSCKDDGPKKAENKPAREPSEILAYPGLGEDPLTVVVGRDGEGEGIGDGGAEGAADPDPVPQNELFVCEIDGVPTVGDASASWIIDDFEDGDNRVFGNGLAGWWFFYGDDSGGWQTPESWQAEAGGPPGSALALHAAGGDFTDWGSATAFSMATASADDKCVFDASAYDGFSFWIRGSIEVQGSSDQVQESERGAVRVQMIEKRVIPLEEGGSCDPNRNTCWDSHRVRITPTECWRRHSIRFDEMQQDGWGQDVGPLDTAALSHAAFEVSAYQSYDFWLDDLSFFVGEAPEPVEDCSLVGLGGGSGL